MLSTTLDSNVPLDQLRDQLLPPPEILYCHSCNRRSTRCVTKPTGNGNDFRPYYKCINCGIFFVFADSRGNLPSNEPCDCGTPSKLQVSNKKRELHFVCRLGKCDYHEWMELPNGERVNLENCSKAWEYYQDKLI